VPELPDVTLYCEALERHVRGRALERIRLASPFLLRTVEPPLPEAQGRIVRSAERIGKRIAVGLDGDLFLVFHLMIAGRFRWRERGQAVPKKVGLAAFDFPNGTLLLTEQGSRKRASLHVVSGRASLAALDPGGIEVLDCTLAGFSAALRHGNHTLKRALTNPRRLSGIGGAYSDEIMWEAKVSPLTLNSKLTDDEVERLWRATREVLARWIERLREKMGDRFPEKVSAFQPEMAVHGKYKEPCPRCGAPVQRIVYASNETNYCAPCQTGGKLLADRALSQLLKKDWPKTVEGWEELRNK
jgi:formamidopyrimidine-DNA glycosylase